LIPGDHTELYGSGRSLYGLGGNCEVASEVARNRINGKIQQPCEVCVFEVSPLHVDSRDFVTFYAHTMFR
jgi:hypothetical protein